MTYIVPVEFRIEAKNADEAATLIEQALNSYRLPPNQVQSGYKEDVKDVKISPELAAYLDSLIQDNDNDTSGWETDLDWCFQVTEDNDAVNKEIVTELDALITEIGGAVKAAAILPEE